MFADTARPSPELVSYRERMLLLAAAVFVVLNRVLLVLVRGVAWYGLLPGGGWLACTVGLPVVLNRVLPHCQALSTAVVLVLGGRRLTLVSRLAPPFEVRQTIWLAISVVALLAVVVLLPPHLRVLKRYRYTWLLAGVVLFAATLIFGVNPSGDAFAPRLWLGFRVIFF